MHKVSVSKKHTGMESQLVPQDPSIRECHARVPRSEFRDSPSQTPGNSPFSPILFTVNPQHTTIGFGNAPFNMEPGSIIHRGTGNSFPSRRSGVAGCGRYSTQSQQPVGLILRAERSRDPFSSIGHHPPRCTRQSWPLPAYVSSEPSNTGRMLGHNRFRRIGDWPLRRNSPLCTIMRHPVRHMDSRTLCAIQLASSNRTIGTHAAGLHFAASGFGLHRALDARAGPSQPRSQTTSGPPSACAWRSHWYCRGHSIRVATRRPTRYAPSGTRVADAASGGDRRKIAGFFSCRCRYEANLTRSPQRPITHLVNRLCSISMKREIYVRDFTTA